MGPLAATFRTALADAWANRRSFWVQVSVMIVNDLAWVVFWVLFFGKVGRLRGWDVHDVLVLFSILLVTTGVGLGLLANARKVGQLAADGELDAVLALPISPLGYLLCRRIDTAMLGDLAMGPVLFAVAGHPTPARVAVFVLGSACGAAVLVGFLVAVGALTLFVGGRGEQGDLGFQAILILASYPLDVFGGATKVLLFTAVPAAFVTGLPARLVHGFDPALAGVVIGAAVGFMALGSTLFSLGLRRYSSGALFTRA